MSILEPALTPVEAIRDHYHIALAGQFAGVRAPTVVLLFKRDQSRVLLVGLYELLFPKEILSAVVV